MLWLIVYLAGIVSALIVGTNYSLRRCDSGYCYDVLYHSIPSWLGMWFSWITVLIVFVLEIRER